MTWLLLATGRLSWSAALTAGKIKASGNRADLSAYLPQPPESGSPERAG